MIAISNRALEEMKERLLEKCIGAGLGFRVLAQTNGPGRITFTIKVDESHPGDAVAESNGIMVFVDPETVAQVGGYELDYSAESGGAFFLCRMTEDENEKDQDSGAV